ncbi:hypothetical protein F511_11079 [Dorcoceras hygrometricum]|uniref:Rubredoxin family protein n=1 Tax=Dorcoceras hygrometricum TaxID=472368 RepID=A0A2Z7AJ75_9LAMI|nr:hypothetical protein F511_11079 [Dorcoceras hygrometricum]
MSSAMAAGASSSFTANLSAKANSSYLAPKSLQKSSFQGSSLQGAKRVGVRFNNASGTRRGLEITAKAAGTAKNIEVEVDKPLGLTLGQKTGGGVVITGVESGGNAARAGLKVGDQVIYTSSFFGDELWPADKLGFTKTAIQAKPDSVYFVVSRGVEVDVKRLPKRPAPPTFGRKLNEAQKATLIILFRFDFLYIARATHICLDCGYIYTLQKSFDDQPDDYACPQCRAPKKRFSRYDVNTGKAIGGNSPPIGVIIGLLVGIGGVGALLVYGLQ